MTVFFLLRWAGILGQSVIRERRVRLLLSFINGDDECHCEDN